MEAIERIEFPGLQLADGDTLTLQQDETGSTQSVTVTRKGETKPKPVKFKAG